MARSIWTGALTFGLVNVPVGLYSATSEHDVSFNQFQRGTSDRIRYKRVNERTGEEVAFKDIVKGHDLGGGDYVIIEPEELEAIAPGRSRALDVQGFVDLDEVDPIFFQKSYYLAPAGEQYAKTYALLAEALERTNKAGIATFVMRGKQYLAAVRADRGVLTLETMYFADEVRDPHQELPSLPEDVDLGAKELDLAASLVESMSVPWQPEDYHDTYTEKVEELIEAKREGREVVSAEAPGEATNVVDLFEALRQSVEAAKARRGGGESAEETGTSTRDAAPDETGKARGGRRSSAKSSGKGAADKGTADKGAAGKATAEDLSGLSKAELDDRAKALDISGRSKMSKAELARAVAEAEQAASPAKPSRRRKAS